MSTREQFKRAVIEKIHGLPYRKAIKKDRNCITVSTLFFTRRIPIITIGRVMQALGSNDPDCGYCISRGFIECVDHCWGEIGEKEIFWKLTKENGVECTDDDQTDETIESLTKLLCPQ